MHLKFKSLRNWRVTLLVLLIAFSLIIDQQCRDDETLKFDGSRNVQDVANVKSCSGIRRLSNSSGNHCTTSNNKLSGLSKSVPTASSNTRRQYRKFCKTHRRLVKSGAVLCRSFSTMEWVLSLH